MVATLSLLAALAAALFTGAGGAPEVDEPKQTVARFISVAAGTPAAGDGSDRWQPIRVYFAHDKSSIDAAGLAALGTLAQALTEVFAEVGTSADSAATEEAFEILEGFPDELAVSVLSTLSKTVNRPIGEKPKSTPRSEAHTAGQSSSGQSRPTSVDQSPEPDSIAKPLAYGVLFAMIFIFIVRFLARRSRR